MENKKEKKYRLTLNEHQLRLIANCVEDCSRFMTGQMELYNCTASLDDMHELHDKLNELQRLVTPRLCRGSYYNWSGSSCPNDEQRKFIAESYYIYREIIHQLTVDKGIKNVYSSPTLTCEDSGEPILIEKV